MQVLATTLLSVHNLLNTHFAGPWVPCNHSEWSITTIVSMSCHRRSNSSSFLFIWYHTKLKRKWVDDNISKYGKYGGGGGGGGVKTQVSGEAGLVESKSSKTENQSSVCTGNSILTMQTVKLVNSE